MDQGRSPTRLISPPDVDSETTFRLFSHLAALSAMPAAHHEEVRDYPSSVGSYRSQFYL